MSENKKVLELDVSVIESKERQSKPDYRDVAIQSCPDCKNSAVQTHSEPTVVATTGKQGLILVPMQSLGGWREKEPDVYCSRMCVIISC